MRGLRVACIAAAVAAAPAFAQTFHSGGVAACEGCHTMHNSSESFVNPAGTPKPQMTSRNLGVGTTNPFLLQGSDPSSTCLICHQRAGDTGPNGVHISTADADMPPGLPPLQLTPGGDFGWLKKDYGWAPSAESMGTGRSKGERHGHSIVAADFGYVADSRTVAPGGIYPGAALSCISCHDPHGRYRITSVPGPTSVVFATSGKPIRGSGSYGDAPDSTTAVGAYRLLGGAGYVPRSIPVENAFTYKPPVAVAPVTFNRSEATSDTRVSYGQGTSEWCANCHPLMHSYLPLGGNGLLVHPVGAPMATEIYGNYNRYRGTGILNGSATTAYLSLVPFQIDNTTDLARLKTLTASTAGPTANSDAVMCLSCHRAHASAFGSSLRWSMENEFITVDNAYPDPVANPDQAQGRTLAETQQAYYGRPASAFGRWQRVLCNKCHLKD
jgi:hypothetical protein